MSIQRDESRRICPRTCPWAFPPLDFHIVKLAVSYRQSTSFMFDVSSTVSTLNSTLVAVVINR